MSSGLPITSFFATASVRMASDSSPMFLKRERAAPVRAKTSRSPRSPQFETLWKQSRQICPLEVVGSGGESPGAHGMREDVTKTDAILLVEDDVEIGELITRYLATHQIEASVVTDGRAMDATLAARDFDLVILDLNLPGEDGLSICRRLRDGANLPIIIVTAQGEDVDRIIGLEMGADDYLVKPFNPRELLARVRSVLRRSRSATQTKEPTGGRFYQFEGWRVDIMAHQVTAPTGMKIALTGAEFDLLYALCERPNRVLTRDQLIDLTHGPTASPFQRSIDVLISRLRQKLESDPKNPKLIQTVRSEGYMFAPQVLRA
jgi:two-component system, OmpR family, response regulator